MIVESINKHFDSYQTSSFLSPSKLVKILEKRSQFKDELLQLFHIDTSYIKIFKVGNSNALIDAILDIDNQVQKVDIGAEIKDIQLQKLLSNEMAVFEIFNVIDNYILRSNGSDILEAETTYSAKNDLLDYYNFGKFANYCRDKNYEDLVNLIKEYLKDKNASNSEKKNLRLVHRFYDDKYFIRAITSVNGYKDFGINFSVFVAIAALSSYVEKTKQEIFINRFKVNESNIYVSFALKGNHKVADNLFLSFNLILENDEIKRGSVSFNGMFKLELNQGGKKSELYLKPTGLKVDGERHHVDLLSYQHRGDVQTVFDKINKLPDLIEFFINQVSEDSKRISTISHPDDVRKFIKEKIKNSRKAEFQVYKHDVLKKLMSISVSNTFKLFELLREVEDLFEHDDIESINFWRSKLYEALIEKK